MKNVLSGVSSSFYFGVHTFVKIYKIYEIKFGGILWAFMAIFCDITKDMNQNIM